MAGFSLAVALRDLGYSNPIRLVGDEPHLPYNRTALTKVSMAGEVDLEKIALAKPAELAAMDIEVVADSRARSLSLQNRTITVENGGRLQELPFESIAIATGLRPRQLDASGNAEVHCLRNMSDLIALRDRITGSQRVCIVGSGILGLELASNLAEIGKTVTVVGRSLDLVTKQFGNSLAARVETQLKTLGVEIIFGSVETHTQCPSGYRLSLSGGLSIDSDLLISAIGSIPNSEWLHDSGINLKDGFVSTQFGSVAENVYALGDVALWTDYENRFGSMPSQARTNNHARHLARRLTDNPVSPLEQPYFWSQIGGLRLQAVGDVSAQGVPLIQDGQRALFLHRKGEQVVGISSFGFTREFAQARQKYPLSKSPEEAWLHDQKQS
jgi:NADPH-dependent 2,4-dienoyl-CoA reductase/sulfur reductase-like enzyme